MSTIAVLNQKGGVGKTTLSTNIARWLVMQGNSTLLVDADRQGSAQDWHAAGDGELVSLVRMDSPTLAKDLPKVASPFDWVVIDGPPRITNIAQSAIKAADVVLIPVQPSPYDIWSASDVVEMVKDRQDITDGSPKAAFVISRAISGTQLAREVQDALEAYEIPIFKARTCQRVVYASSAINGSSVLDDEMNGPAAAEIRAIVRELKEFING